LSPSSCHKAISRSTLSLEVLLFEEVDDFADDAVLDTIGLDHAE
jgi:hypothetical protein